MLKKYVVLSKLKSNSFHFSIVLSLLIPALTSANAADIDAQLSEIITANLLTGTPKNVDKLPLISSPKAQLGMKLFYSKSLGGDNTTACASCHHPMLGGGDGLSLSIGVDSESPDIMGIHRKLKKNKSILVPRNAPTTFNIGLWEKALFHDMRIEKIKGKGIYTPDFEYPKVDALAGDNLVQAQARFPVTSDAEMRGDYLKSSFNQTLRRALAKRLEKNWLVEFQTGFNFPNGSADELITEQNFSEAIAEYERSQVFIDTPWKAYIEGDKTAISNRAKIGAKLFYTAKEQDGAGCVQCHSGDFFTDENAYNTAMPQIGVGKGSGVTKTNDYGCNLITKKKKDLFRFRTPTLLNVEVTGPWGHDGAYTSLEGITRHMLLPTASARNYDTSQLTQKNIAVKDVGKNTQEAINAGLHLSKKPNFKETDVTYLVEFLKTLTDPCVKDRACLSKWIPNSNDNDPDGQMFHARNGKTGKAL